MSTINWALKQRITEIFGTQADFAQALGVESSLISLIVRQRRQPSDSMKVDMCKLLRSTAAQLWPEV